MKPKLMSYDWAAMLEQLFQAGLSMQEVNGGAMSDRMVHHYRKGAQPMHWRGERILDFWCSTFRKTREHAPVREVVRGHRVDRRHIPGPRLQELPNWPAAPVSVAPIKRKPGRPGKTEVAA